MEIDAWIEGFKVRSFPWIDGKRIYFNVRYYLPGQSISQPPVWDKTVYIVDNEGAQRVLNHLLHTLVDSVSRMRIPEGAEVTITIA